MKKLAVILGLGLFIGSCSTQKGAQTSGVNSQTSNVSTSSAIIKNVLHKTNNFNHLVIKSKITADLGDMDTGIDATISVDNQDKIWINAQKFIFKARAEITPEGFKAYENFSKSYIDGDFAFINKLLGVDFIDYNKFQNLLLGRVFVDLNQEKYTAERINNQYKIVGQSKANYAETYVFDSGFRLLEAHLKDEKQNIDIHLSYADWVKAEKEEFPKKVKILVKDKKTKQIDLEYNSFTYQQIDTPFSIPTGYKKREIK